MGVNERSTARTVRIPTVLVAFVNRVMALPPGIHTIHIVKAGRGAAGLIGWAVTVGERLEGGVVINELGGSAGENREVAS